MAERDILQPTVTIIYYLVTAAATENYDEVFTPTAECQTVKCQTHVPLLLSPQERQETPICVAGGVWREERCAHVKGRVYNLGLMIACPLDLLN